MRVDRIFEGHIYRDCIGAGEMAKSVSHISLSTCVWIPITYYMISRCGRGPLGTSVLGARAGRFLELFGWVAHWINKLQVQWQTFVYQVRWTATREASWHSHLAFECACTYTCVHSVMNTSIFSLLHIASLPQKKGCIDPWWEEDKRKD